MEHNKIYKNLDKLTEARVLVIGDIMLDKYIFGSVSRISPEAPVPVLKTEKEIKTLGGAANVAHNIAALKAGCALIGVAGNDPDKAALREMLNDLSIDSALIYSGQKTTAKIRVIGEHQQIVRIDYEDTFEPSPEIYKTILTHIDSRIFQVNAIILSDYGKGFVFADLCRYVITNANSAGKITVIDPKGADWSKYTDATIVTPNIKELGEAAGLNVPNTDEDVAAAGKKIREMYNLKYLVVTRSEKGITIISEKFTLHLPTQAQEVYDVSGAGDTVVAVLAVMLGAGFNIEEAVAAANASAGVVVSKIGTVPITYAELFRVCSGRKSEAAASFDQLLIRLEEARADGKKIVFTNGCFDVLHRGHIDYMRRARKLGDMLIVGLNSDASTKRLKGQSRPINNQNDRAFMLSALECVDHVVVFEEDTPYNLLAQIRPDILVKGGDYESGEVVGREFAGDVVIMDFVYGYSTTSILEKIKNAEETK
ncbi:MAG: bifunctional D-glycero-beta-D-manno-heptose-7-phosphate kinase/D-glycero-beta-D-manno-heptose 1-phosphate adenylyltransferase HldE [Deferribacteraceae bacterium]|jgi:D-beta-D-heptose 7-phosphate kinase/D-beta-D-heptose 1-phosphate adenosyltransferase|nr:bifunctional D-glycero-beta-D-manno-heptose-7-phosphate kinase/D-glycero-beta-D-manno-heptose 1-phosphate adenylyltransferase HldE [Deferribacteraceae bacterium]